MNKKLYVGNLLYEVTDDQLKDQFSQAGQVVSAQVIRFADSGRSKGFGFVEMETEEGAQQAMQMFNEQDYLGRKMIVNEARPQGERSERRPRFGGGGNRGGGDRRHSGGGGGGGGRRFNNRDSRDNGGFNRQNDYNQGQPTYDQMNSDMDME